MRCIATPDWENYQYDKFNVQLGDTREVVNIAQLNTELKTTVAKIDQLRKEIDAIVADIEGTQTAGDEA